MMEKLIELEEKYNKIFMNYLYLDEELENYKDYKRKKEIINNVIISRKNINNPKEYQNAINAYENEFHEKYNVFNIRKIKFKTKINYKKIDYKIIEKYKYELLNLKLEAKMLNEDININKLLNDFEKRVVSINAKIELLNYESLNNSENDINKFIFDEMKKGNNIESNLIKKVDEKQKIKAIDRKNARKLHTMCRI